MKEAYYFSHDSNARYDEKILALRSVYKAEGYGWYWILIEMMRDANAYRLHYDGKYSFTVIAKELGCDDGMAKQFIDDCINEFHLFVLSDGYFQSVSLLRRMDKVEEKRRKAIESARARWDKEPNAMRTHNDGNAIKEKKGNKKKVNPPIPPEGDAGTLPGASGSQKEKRHKPSTAKEWPPVTLPFSSQSFYTAWVEWKEYRKSLRNPIRSEKAEVLALKQLNAKALENEAVAIQIIENSIANGWHGLYESKGSNTNATQAAASTPTLKHPDAKELAKKYE